MFKSAFTRFFLELELKIFILVFKKNGLEKNGLQRLEIEHSMVWARKHMSLSGFNPDVLSRCLKVLIVLSSMINVLLNQI